ncbi:unnamed protein product [Rotaria sp. Silwood1]|nr:unnamed protein product [Rotaria sp. Silwood1]
MLLAFQSLQQKSTVNETNESQLQIHSKILSREEESPEKSTVIFNGEINKQEKFLNEIDNNLKRSRQMELAHNRFIQQCLRGEATLARRYQRRRQRSSTSSSNNSFNIDRILQDDDNDWLFEKILDKFENIRLKKANRRIKSRSNVFNNDIAYGLERIIERRYYVRKPQQISKRNQLTSTDDLKEYIKKPRQLSGVSSVTVDTALTSNSQYTSTTPTYLEEIHNQSNLLRDEISELKDEIERLQTSQQDFFEQLKLQFQSNNINSTTKTKNLVPSKTSSRKSSLEQKPLFSNIPIRSTNGQRSNSPSHESVASSSTRVTTANSDLTVEPTSGSTLVPLNVTVAPVPPISEFIATKNPTIPSSSSPSLLVNGHINSKLSLTTPTSSISEFIATKNSSTLPLKIRVHSKPSSNASTSGISDYIETKNTSVVSPTNGYISSKLPSVPITSPINAHVDSKSSSTTSTSRISELVETKNQAYLSTSTVNRSVSSKPSSVLQSLNTYSGSKLTSITTTSPRSVQGDSKRSSATSTPQISEYIETKIPIFVSSSKINEYVSSKPPSVPTTPPIVTYANSKFSSITSTPSPTSTYANVKSSSIQPTLPINTYFDTKPSSTSPLFEFIQTNNPLFVSTSKVNEYVNSRPSSTLPIIEFISPESPSMETGSSVFVPVESVGLQTPPLVPNSPISFTSMTSDQIPVYDNELEQRRVLSPRSQIVASSIPNHHETSDSSPGWSSPEPNHPIHSEVPLAALQDQDLQALIQYSSQLEISGFPSSITHVIANPNTSSTFWEAVDEFLDNYKLTTTDVQLQPISQIRNTNNRYVFDNNITRQLDKYNLEIKPQEIIESSAPLLMPPLDIS